MAAPKTISGHLKDLLRRDISVALDCVDWLSPNQRDIDRRARPKRLANRYIAACMIVEASKNPAFLREVLDRTEGRVKEVLEVSEIRSLSLNIVLTARKPALDEALEVATQSRLELPEVVGDMKPVTFQPSCPLEEDNITSSKSAAQADQQDPIV